MINKESIQSLIAKNKDDTEILKFIEECLLSFSDYHARIYKLETWRALYGYHNMSKENYQHEFTTLDKARTNCHNSVIDNLNILNRLCKQNEIPLVYEGVISAERPHRVEIADAVLLYVENTVKQRIK